jgi:hypothetical protein
MTQDESSPTPRREFLGQLATAAVTLTGVACARSAGMHGTAAPVTPSGGRAGGGSPASGTAAASGSAGAPAAAAAQPAPRKWDDGWATKLTAKHRAVFDAPEVAEGIVLANAFIYARSYREVYGVGDADLQAVLVVRHRAMPLVLVDRLWEKYELGKEVKLKDERTGKWATRNVFAAEDGSNPNAIPGLSLEGLRQHGALLLACNIALANLGGRLARRTGQDAAAVRAELRAGLLPGVEIVPSGIFGVMRAQEAGCTYMRST